MGPGFCVDYLVKKNVIRYPQHSNQWATVIRGGDLKRNLGRGDIESSITYIPELPWIHSKRVVTGQRIMEYENPLSYGGADFRGSGMMGLEVNVKELLDQQA